MCEVQAACRNGLQATAGTVGSLSKALKSCIYSYFVIAISGDAVGSPGELTGHRSVSVPVRLCQQLSRSHRRRKGCSCKGGTSLHSPSQHSPHFRGSLASLPLMRWVQLICSNQTKFKLIILCASAAVEICVCSYAYKTLNWLEL